MAKRVYSRSGKRDRNGKPRYSAHYRDFNILWRLCFADFANRPKEWAQCCQYVASGSRERALQIDAILPVAGEPVEMFARMTGRAGELRLLQACVLDIKRPFPLPKPMYKIWKQIQQAVPDEDYRLDCLKVALSRRKMAIRAGDKIRAAMRYDWSDSEASERLGVAIDSVRLFRRHARDSFSMGALQERLARYLEIDKKSLRQRIYNYNRRRKSDYEREPFLSRKRLLARFCREVEGIWGLSNEELNNLLASAMASEFARDMACLPAVSSRIDAAKSARFTEELWASRNPECRTMAEEIAQMFSDYN